jgi:hypothetical protein
MFTQQHQNRTRALARGSTGIRPNGAPAYYLGRPASLWISALSPALQAQRTQSPGRRHHR